MSKCPSKLILTLCKQINLSRSKLLNLQPLKQVEVDKITNGLVIELIQLRNVEKLPSWMVSWTKLAY